MSKKLKFSVVIPSLNRPESLEKCLESFTLLEYPADAWELIVVNDGGLESFEAVTDELKNRLPLKLIDIDHAGPATARNKGFGQSRGKYIAFTDDDCRVEPDWLSRFEEGFDSGSWDALGGRALNPYMDNAAAVSWHQIIDFLYDYLQDNTGNSLLLISNNAAYRRSVFEALGGFDESFPFAGGEDIELSHRLIAGGFRQRYLPDAKTLHYHKRLIMLKFLSRQFRYGRGYCYYIEALKKNNISRNKLIKPRSDTPFKVAFLQSLCRNRVSPTVWLLTCLSQFIVHPAGLYYQTICNRAGFTA